MDGSRAGYIGNLCYNPFMAFGNFTIENGKALPLGATVTDGGVNFAVFSRHALEVSLLLFESGEPGCPNEEIKLNSKNNRTGDVWHCFIPGLKPLTCYLYRAKGPYIPEKGYRYNCNKTLIDPYTKALTDLSDWDLSACLGYDPYAESLDLSYSYIDDVFTQPRSIVIDDAFDWQGDLPLNYPLRFSILYETHVKGLTQHPHSGNSAPGTYSGVLEKIPFFKDLGVTSLEFLPIHEFNENELIGKNPVTGKRLVNYWGYSTVSFFAPKGSYAHDRSLGGQVHEFKVMVRELHKAGIEVILDIVFNHTAEGDERGPTFSFRGLDNSIYYMLDQNRSHYKNYSGCGNTVNCNHPVVRTFIMDCLRYWVVEMHVDGFRFDLGSILGRDEDGRLMENPPMLQGIAEDPVLSSTKIIAEAWDAGGAYQVGWFPGGRWAEWNDRFRDDVRRYWRGDPKQTRHLATRLSGSSDLYLRDGRKPFHSINFITSHDGFTLKDLVTYEQKHNEENGEKNNDGNSNNYSANYGVEGPCDVLAIEGLRFRQMKNFIATMMVSLGTPMILGGDEMGRTQRGNNNAYCQDNEISWYDWAFLTKNAGYYRFVKEMIAFRKRHPGFMRPEFYTGKDGNYNAIPDITWFDERGNTPDWDEIGVCIAFRLDGSEAETLADKDDNDFFIMFNSGKEAVKFRVCEPLDGKKWVRAVDTGLPSPQDIMPQGSEEVLADPAVYDVKGHSMAVLISRLLY